MRCVFECRSSILRDSRAGYGPMVTERLEPDIPEALTLELGLRRNRPNPNGSGAGLGPSAPGPRARTPHEILLCNNGQEEIRTAEILTPVDFIWAPSRSILKESNGIVERAPED